MDYVYDGYNIRFAGEQEIYSVTFDEVRGSFGRGGGGSGTVDGAQCEQISSDVLALFRPQNGEVHFQEAEIKAYERPTTGTMMTILGTRRRTTTLTGLLP